jgi:hypothetical protein
MCGHPEIFMPEEWEHKEPAYFCDLYGMRRWEDYVKLFEGAGSSQRVGEASTAYLSAPESPDLIHNRIPDARFIVILRNPIDRAYSLYRWMAKEGYEEHATFEAALKAEANRDGDKVFMRTNPENYWNYLYFRSGLYSEQLERFFSLFGRDRVCIHMFEDLSRSIDAVAQVSFSFLGVAPESVPKVGVANAGKGVRSVSVQYFSKQALPSLCKRLGLPGGERLSEVLTRWNRNGRKPPPMRASTRDRLKALYAKDIERTSCMIGKDLKHWLA